MQEILEKYRDFKLELKADLETTASRLKYIY